MTRLTPDNTQRELLDALLDQIIPANADRGIPAAGALGVAAFIEQRVAADAELGRLFQQGLATAAMIVSINGLRVEPDVVRQLELDAPDFFAALIRLTYMGYYSRGDIRGLLGLSPKPVHPDGYDVPEQDLDEIRALTAPVAKRGPCYRAV
ncbi:MAG: gluconate 2-dehydrogenase subunit 3 family protein [Geminicoccaceae bacterium]